MTRTFLLRRPTRGLILCCLMLGPMLVACSGSDTSEGGDGTGSSGQVTAGMSSGTASAGSNGSGGATTGSGGASGASTGVSSSSSSSSSTGSPTTGATIGSSSGSTGASASSSASTGTQDAGGTGSSTTSTGSSTTSTGTSGGSTSSSTGGVKGDAGVGADAGRDGEADAEAGRRDGGSNDAAGADAGAFQPCPPAGTACRIMPLGDSITEGFASSAPGGGYRVELFRQAVTNSQLVTFVGSLTNGPNTVSGKPFPRNHEGHDGYTIDDGSGHSGIYPLVAQTLTNNRPNIVLLMIGTNDVNGNVDLANAPTRLGLLLDRITSTSPDALVVVAKIIPTTNDGTNTRVRAYNDAIPGVVAQRTAMGKHILVVDMYSTFTSNTNYKTALMADNLHPNDTGYALLGQTWYAAIRDLLPAAQ